MFDLALNTPALSSADAERPLAPARALLTPTWIAALAVLILNDHVLKGAHLLPGVVTGKLSDFAGMIVAPVLLAALLRVRTRGALLACHLAVGAVFAGIQLSPSFAASWSALMGAIGFPWLITCDPSDLIALPTLALAWRLLVPEMDPSLPALTPLRRSAVACLSFVGLWSTVATSQVEPGVDWDDTWFEDVYGNVFINNANEHDIALFVRPLRADVQLDCLQVAQDPGRMLRPEAFGEAEHWLLPPRTNVAIELSGASACGAAWVGGEGISPRIIFVDQVTMYAAQWFSGQSFDPSALGVVGVGVEFGEQSSRWIGNDQLLYVPRDEAPELPEECEAPAADSRIDWSPVRYPRNELLSVEAGIDGCFELGLQGLELDANEGAVAVDEPYTWYLCAPAAGVPLEAGEFLDIRAGVQPFGNSVDVTLLDPETLEPARDEQGLLLRHARYLRGSTDPSHIEPLVERSLTAVPTVSCPWATEPGCATVERGAQLAVTGAQSYLELGEAVAFGGDTMVHTAVLSHASERAVIDGECTSGAQSLVYDIDIVIIDEPL